MRTEPINIAKTSKTLKRPELLFLGDVDVLRQQAGRPSAFAEKDSGGRLPLHAAALQPQPDVLRAALRGEDGGLGGRGGGLFWF